MRAVPHDPLERFPDVVAALSAALPPKPAPPSLKARLDARLLEFAREREASFNLLSRPADRLRTKLLFPPDGRRAGRPRPLGRIVVSDSGREVAFFCWYLRPLAPYSLAVRRADGREEGVADFSSDGSGDGELPYFRLSPGAALTGVEVRAGATGEVVLAARL